MGDQIHRENRGVHLVQFYDRASRLTVNHLNASHLNASHLNASHLTAVENADHWTVCPSDHPIHRANRYWGGLPQNPCQPSPLGIGAQGTGKTKATRRWLLNTESAIDLLPIIIICKLSPETRLHNLRSFVHKYYVTPGGLGVDTYSQKVDPKAALADNASLQRRSNRWR